MQWTAAPGAGFSRPGVEPWLPYGDYTAYNVGSQRDDPESMLTLTRDLIRLRRRLSDLRRGRYERLAASDERLWAWRRGDRTVVACNLSDEPALVADVGARRIELSTIRARAGERIADALPLGSWEAVIAVSD
jgi:glycosidase